MNCKHQITGIDLSQHIPIVYENGNPNSELNLKMIPCAILPLFPREKPIFGQSALVHRRGRGYEWPPESRITLESEPGHGCGRVPLIAAYAKMVQIENSWGSKNAKESQDFIWSPNAQQIIAKAADLIVDSACSFSISTPGQKILVTPDSFQEVSLERMKNSSRRYSGSQTLKYIPRSMALALRWIEEHYPNRINDLSDGFVGHLRICSFSLDEWILHAVPLQIVLENKKKFLVPVFDPNVSSYSLGVWGTVFACLSSILKMTKTNPRDIWREVFSGEYLHELLNLSAENLRGHCLNIWMLKETAIEYSYLEKCMKLLPHLKDVPYELISKTKLITKAAEKWEKQYQNLPDGSKNLMGVVIDGSLSKLPFEQDMNIGEVLSLLNLKIKSHKLIAQNNLKISRASEGAAYFGERLANNYPTYRYTLIPIDIFCETDTEEGVDWIPLIKKGLTLDAGRTEKPYVIPNFYIKKDSSDMNFTLRKPCTGNGDSDYIYRRIKSTKINKAPTKDIPVKLYVTVKPGDGFALVEVRSLEGETLATLEWTDMEECEKPKPRPLGYLPHLNRIRQSNEYWEDVVFAFRYLNTIQKTKVSTIEKALKELWNRLKANKRNTDKPYESFGPISLEGNVPEGSIKELREFLLDLWFDPKIQIQPKIIKRLTQCFGWLYGGVPKEFKSYLIRFFKTKKLTDFKQDHLSCAGKIFSDISDIQLFYFTFSKRIQLGIDKLSAWISALTNIARYNPEALKTDVIESLMLDQFIGCLCTILEEQNNKKTCKRIAMTSVRALGSLLYRRKFDKLFLKEDSQIFQRVEDALHNMLDFAETPYKQNIIESTITFLKIQGTEAEAMLLYKTDDDEGYGDSDDESDDDKN